MFTLRQLAERDEWLCGICETHVDANAVAPYPLAATIDHVVPIARGGAHAFDNVQLAHFECNWRKGAA